jgi:hypothetical protein
MTIKQLVVGVVFYVLGMTAAYMLDPEPVPVHAFSTVPESIPVPDIQAPVVQCTTDIDCMQKFPDVEPY